MTRRREHRHEKPSSRRRSGSVLGRASELGESRLENEQPSVVLGETEDQQPIAIIAPQEQELGAESAGSGEVLDLREVRRLEAMDSIPGGDGEKSTVGSVSGTIGLLLQERDRAGARDLDGAESAEITGRHEHPLASPEQNQASVGVDGDLTHAGESRIEV